MLNVAVVQTHSMMNPQEGLENMLALLDRAVNESIKPDLVIFPEFCVFSPAGKEDALAAAETEDGNFITTMRQKAKEYGIVLIPGTFQEKAEGDLVYNSQVVIGKDGEIIGKYHKTHLYRAFGYDEHDYVEFGDKLVVLDVDFGAEGVHKLGIMTCFDIRFPEIARSLVNMGAELICVPFEFSPGAIWPARDLQWDTLTKATALFNLTYFVGCNQSGQVPNTGEWALGQSRVIDPWGTVIADAGPREDPVILHVPVDFEYQEKVRGKINTWNIRRPELYNNLF